MSRINTVHSTLRWASCAVRTLVLDEPINACSKLDFSPVTIAVQFHERKTGVVIVNSIGIPSRCMLRPFVCTVFVCTVNGRYSDAVHQHNIVIAGRNVAERGYAEYTEICFPTSFF